MQKPMTLMTVAVPPKSGYYIVRMKMGTDQVADAFGFLTYERWWNNDLKRFEEGAGDDNPINFEAVAWRPVEDDEFDDDHV